MTDPTIIPDDSISGNKIHGGVISEFQSDGIQDLATTTSLIITNGTATVDRIRTKTLDGNIDVTGNISVAGSISIAENIEFEKDLIVGKNLSIGGMLGVHSIRTSLLDGDVVVSGELKADTINSDNLAISKDITVTGSVTADVINANVINGKINIDGDFSVANDLIVDGNINAIKDVNVKGNVAIDGVLDVGIVRAFKIITEENPVIDSNIFSGNSDSELDGKGLRFTAPGIDVMLVYRAGEKIWSNGNIDITQEKSYQIDNTNVLSFNQLGSSVVKSSLREVGTLNKLRVTGDTLLSDFAHFSTNSNRLGLNTESPNGALGIVDNNIEIVLGSSSAHRAKIGTYTNDHLDIITDDTTRISITNNGEVVIGHSEYKDGILRINGKLYVDEVIADTRLLRSSSLTFEKSLEDDSYGKGIEWVGNGAKKKLVLLANPDRIHSTESIDVAEGSGYFINGNPVLSRTALGPSVAESSLVKVGILQDLTVAGNADITNVITSNLHIGSLQLSDSAINVIDSLEVKRNGNTDLAISALAINIGDRQNINRPVRISGRVGINVSNPSADIELAVAGNLSFANKKFSTNDSIPTTGSFNKGDIVWNTIPTIGGYVGWVCTVEGTPGQWRPFGLIA
jgi:hypothetical protein